MKPTTPQQNNNDITRLLTRVKAGDREAYDQVFALAYQELYLRAHQQRIKWNGDFTLNTGALINEAYIKLIGQQQTDWKNRLHFLAAAGKAIRHILIDYSRKKLAAKRGGDIKHHTLSELEENNIPIIDANSDQLETLLSLDNALKRLSQYSKRECQVVECRFFAGLSVSDTAKVLNISTATVKRDWAMAQAWLMKHMNSQETRM